MLSLVCYATLIVYNILIFDWIKFVSNGLEKDAKLAAASELIAMQSQQYEDMIAHNDYISRLRHDQKNFILGILLLVIAVIAEVGHASITKSLSGNYSSQIIVMYQFLIGSIYLLPLFIWKGIDGFNMEVYFSAEVWYPIICLAVLCSSLAFSLWVSTIKNLGVAKSSIFSALIPVAAALIAWLLGHEHMNTRQWIGIAISTVGVIMSQYTKNK
jgi:drug/metabolite transporter (DMT)-like permease